MAYEVVSLPFGPGLDTKTDPKMLDAVKLVLLQDCVFTNAKRLTKRPGYNEFTNALVGGGIWSNPTMTANYNNELLLAASTTNGPRLLSWSEDLNAWQDKGQYQSVAVSKEIVFSSGFTATSSGSTISTAGSNTSGAVAENLALFAWDYYPTYGEASDDNATYFSVVDLETGVHLVDNVQIQNALGFSKAIVLGASTFAVAYISSTASNSLRFRIITVTSSGVTVGSEITIGTCGAQDETQFPYCYDYVQTSAGGTFAVANYISSAVDLYLFASAGTLTASASIATTGDIIPVSINQDPSGNFWIYWALDGTTLWYSILSSNLGTAILSTTVIKDDLANIMQITANPTSSQQIVYYSTYVYATGGLGLSVGAIYPTISSAVVNVSGSTPAFGIVLQGLDIYGKVFSINSRVYLPIVSLSYGAGATGFILDVVNQLPVAKFLQTAAEGLYSAGATTDGSYVVNGNALNGVRFPGLINSVWSLTSTKVLFPAGVVTATEPFITDLSASSTNLDANAVETQIGGIAMNPCFLTFDYDDIDAYQSLIQQNTVVLNGGIISQYDGSSCTELQFNVDPDNLSVLGKTSGGAYTVGTLIYYATYESTDKNGNLYESAPSPGVAIKFTTGSSNGVELAVTLCGLTAKTGVTIKFWRSDNQLGGNIAYLVGTFFNNGAGNAYVTFTDNLASEAVLNNETLYTENGAILENLSPPPAMVMWTNNNRLWAIDSENPQTNIEYTKTASQGSGISFSTGQLEIVMDSSGGNITFGSGMDEKTVILKQNAPAFYFVGDGANDAGTGATYSTPQKVPCDAGCSNSKSGILFPGGILFRSTGNKGIYIFSRGVQIQYFGLDVNAYNTQDIQSAELVPNKNQIRFLTSGGFSLLYDYVFNMWSVFTNHTGLSACVFQGAYTYLRTDGALYQEDQTGQYLDNTTPYAPLLRLAWVKAQSTQGFERVRRVMMLGDFQTANGGHGIQISAAYDFVPSFSAPVPYIFTGSNGPYQYRERLARQKCDSVQFQIQEIVTGAAGEYIDFNDLGIEILPKTGLNKLPGSRSVG